MFESDRCLSFAQLYIVLTDMRNAIQTDQGQGAPAGSAERYTDEEDFAGSDEPMATSNIINLQQTKTSNFYPDKTDERLEVEDENQEINSPSFIPGAAVDDLARENQAVEGGRVELDLKHLDKLLLYDLVQQFRYRIKNNHIGEMKYLPAKWNGSLF
jgi:hypothetical protein